VKVKTKDERRRILYVGPPGCGSIPTAHELARQCTLWQGREAEQSYVYRIAGVQLPAHEVNRSIPASGFRAPHYTVNAPQMEGTMRGHLWRPGELHLAHGGVLHLEMVNEFLPSVLRTIAEAWEKGWTMHVSRSEWCTTNNHLAVPCYFTLSMYTTPCPCGWRGVEGRECRCTERQVESWHARSRALTDGAERIELPAGKVTT
jgi:magnesium chelatase family protein